MERTFRGCFRAIASGTTQGAGRESHGDQWRRNPGGGGQGGDRRFVIFSSLNADLAVTHEDMTFRGRFGIVCREAETDAPLYLYLGNGSGISAGESTLKAEEGQSGAYRAL